MPQWPRDSCKQPLRPGNGCRQAGDDVGDLDAALVADFARALDPGHLGGTRPLQMRHDLRARRDGARLEPAVLLVDRRGLGQIRRRARPAPWRRPVVT